MTDEYRLTDAMRDDEDPAPMAESLMHLMDLVVSPILSCLAGYRLELLEIGFDGGAADEMCVELNHILMERVRSILGGVQ